MNPKAIIKIINQYLKGDISRNELKLKANEIKPKVMVYTDYCSYDFLVLDDIVRVLAEIPELSYSDDQLMEILEILENKRNIRVTYLFKMPDIVLEEKDFRLIEIVEDFIKNYECIEISEDKLCTDILSNISKGDLEFLSQMNIDLSKNKNGTVIRTLEMNIFAVLNRFGGLWESNKSCFISGDDVSTSDLIDILKRQSEMLLGKRPIFVSLSGKLENLNVSLF